MTTPCKRRLLRDFRKLRSDPPHGISAAPNENNIKLWNAVIFGYVLQQKRLTKTCRPENSPFEGGTFKLQLEFTDEYPNKPPKVKFLTKMFHPNSKLQNFGFFLIMTSLQ